MNVEAERKNIIGWNQMEIANIPLEGLVGVIEYDNSQVLCVGSLIGVSTVLSITNLPLNIRNTLLKFNKYPLNQNRQLNDSSSSMMAIGSLIVSYQQMPCVNGYYIITFQLVEPLGLQIGYLGTLSFKAVSSYQILSHKISENDSQLIIPFVPQTQYSFADICDDLMIIPRNDLNVKFEFLGLPVISRDPEMGAVIIGLIVKASHTLFQAITLRPRNIHFLQDCIEGKQSSLFGYEEDRICNQLDRLTWKEIHEPNNYNNNGSAHNDGIYSVCRLNFCTIATSSVDKTLSIWQERVQTNNNLQCSFQIEGCCRDLTPLQHGMMLGTNENQVLLMEYNSQYQLEVIGGVSCRHKLYSLLILPKQHRILAGDCYGNITVIRYELPQQSSQNSYASETNNQQSLSLESQIQCSQNNGDTQENTQNTGITPGYNGYDDYGHKGSVNAMHSPSDMNLKVFFSGGEFGEIKMWNTDTLQFMGQFYGHQTQKSVYFLETIVLPNSKSISSISLKQSGSLVSSTKRSGYQLVSGGSDRTVRVWDIDNFSQLRQIDLNNPLYAAAKINQYELIFGSDNQLEILDIEQGKLAQPKEIAHQARINAVCKLSATSFATADIQGSLKIWQIKAEQTLQSGQEKDSNKSQMIKKHERNNSGNFQAGDSIQLQDDSAVVDKNENNTVRQIKPRPRVLTSGCLNNSKQINQQNNNDNSSENNAKPLDNSRFNDKSPLSYKRLSDIAVINPINTLNQTSPQMNISNNKTNDSSSTSCTPKAISKQQMNNQIPQSFMQQQPKAETATATAAITPPKKILNKLSNLSSSIKSSFTDRPSNNNNLISNSKPSFTDRPLNQYDNLNNEDHNRDSSIQNNKLLNISVQKITTDTNKQFYFPQDTTDKQEKQKINTTTSLPPQQVSANEITQNIYPNYNSRQSLSSYMASNPGSSYEGLLKQFDENDKYQIIHSRKICNSTSSNSLSPYASSKGQMQQQQYASNYNSKKHPQGNNSYSNYDQMLQGNSKEHLEIKTTTDDMLGYKKDLSNNQIDMYSQKSTTNTVQTLGSPIPEQQRIRIMSQISQQQQCQQMNSNQHQSIQVQLGNQQNGDCKSGAQQCCEEYRTQIQKLEQENKELREKLKDTKQHNTKYQHQIKQLLKSLEQSEAEREENLEQLKIITPELKKYAEIAQDITHKNQQQAAIIRAQARQIEQLQSNQVANIGQITQVDKSNYSEDNSNDTIQGNQNQDVQQQKIMNSDYLQNVNSIKIENKIDSHIKQNTNEQFLSPKPQANNQKKTLDYPNQHPTIQVQSPISSRQTPLEEQIPIQSQAPLSDHQEIQRNNQLNNTSPNTSNILVDSFGNSQNKGSSFINTARSNNNLNNNNKNNSMLMSREQVMMELRIVQEEALILQKEIKHLKFKASICEDKEEILILLDQLQKVNSKYESANQSITELKSLYGFL